MVSRDNNVEDFRRNMVLEVASNEIWFYGPEFVRYVDSRLTGSELYRCVRKLGKGSLIDLRKAAVVLVEDLYRSYEAVPS